MIPSYWQNLGQGAGERRFHLLNHELKINLSLCQLFMHHIISNESQLARQLASEGAFKQILCFSLEIADRLTNRPTDRRGRYATITQQIKTKMKVNKNKRISVFSEISIVILSCFKQNKSSSSSEAMKFPRITEIKIYSRYFLVFIFVTVFPQKKYLRLQL